MLRRHETLRSRIVMADGRWTLEMLPHRERGARNDRLARAYCDRDEDVRAVEREAALRPFDCSRGLLLRGSLIRVADDEHIVVAVMPHLVSDAWSAHILLDEIMTTLDAEQRGRQNSMQELEVQYGDFVLWQRSWLNGPARPLIREYFAEHLATATPLPLPYDHTDEAALANFDSGAFAFDLSPELSAAIRALAVREHVSPFDSLRGLQHVPSRWCEQGRRPGGPAFAARSHLELFPSSDSLRTSASYERSVGQSNVRGRAEGMRDRC